MDKINLDYLTDIDSWELFKGQHRLAEKIIREERRQDNIIKLYDAGKLRRYKMPFKSKAQQGYMYLHMPKVAKEFESKTKNFKKLPSKVKKRKKK